MVELGKALAREFPLLGASTLYALVWLAVSLAGMAMDSRLVVGANPWLKPMKFGISITIFNLTVGWMLLRLTLSTPAARAISWTVAVAMAVEITAIGMQAARGVPSHYNMSTPLNAAIFTAMAIAIVLNTLAMAGLCLASFAPQEQLAPAVNWGIRLGLVLFLLASLQGFQMVANKGHTVGAPDGGPGLPVLRWSTQAGDLRIAHFAGLHAIQLLPWLGYLLSRPDRTAGVPVVAGIFLLIATLFFWTNQQAWRGRPLVRAGSTVYTPGA